MLVNTIKQFFGSYATPGQFYRKCKNTQVKTPNLALIWISRHVTSHDALTTIERLQSLSCWLCSSYFNIYYVTELKGNLILSGRYMANVAFSDACMLVCAQEAHNEKKPL